MTLKPISTNVLGIAKEGTQQLEMLIEEFGRCFVIMENIFENLMELMQKNVIGKEEKEVERGTSSSAKRREQTSTSYSQLVVANPFKMEIKLDILVYMES